MTRVFYIALMLVVLQSPSSESGFIKKVITDIVGGKDGTKQEAQNYRNPEGNAHQSTGNSGRNTTQMGNQDYTYDKGSGMFGSRPEGHGMSHGLNRPTGMMQGYKNTSSHIVDEDYLTPNGNESLQHQLRPTSGYGGGGTYNKKPNLSSPYKNTTGHIIDEDYLQPNPNEPVQQRPTSAYGGGGTYDKKPTSSNQHNTHNSNRYNENGYPNEQTSTGNNNRENFQTSNHGQTTAGTLRSSLNSNQTQEEENGNCITLTSDNIICIYSNLKEEKIENRKMSCNNVKCNLENNFKKSSLWVCDKIKCTVANIDFSEDTDGKKLLECTMDSRSIITGQEKPVRCGSDEKEHNGRCRKVFGA